MNMGGPDRPEAVQPFLYNLLNDWDLIQFPIPFLQFIFAAIISRKRAREVAKEYARMGDASPQLAMVREQASALQDALGQGYVCRPVFRYWGEGSAEAREALEPGDAVVLLSLYPHKCGATTTSSLRDARSALKGHAGRVVEVENYPVHPGWLAALNARIDEACEGLFAPHLLFSAHGMPQRRIDNGDPYLSEIQATVAAVMATRDEPHSLSFQSKVGPLDWLKPNTLDEVTRLGQLERGPDEVAEVVAIPVAFTSEHIETLVEIGEQIRDVAYEAGVGDFVRCETVQAHPLFIDALADMVRTALSPSE
jgi:protoporphyrin/coproporphyrin ferrochelatase